jgi:CDP-diglyceride synthetase
VDIREGFRFNPGVAGVVLLGLYMILVGVRTQGQDQPALLTAVTALILMLAGYFGIYLITPHDLRWHLLTSLNRLFIQLWPSAIFLCFMIARTPEMALARAEGVQTGPFLSRPDIPAGMKKKGVGKQKRRRQ